MTTLLRQLPTTTTLLTLTLTTITLIPLTHLLKTHPSSPLSPLNAHYLAIKETSTIPPSFSNSRSLRNIVNPRHHIENALTDTRSITFSSKTSADIVSLSDEEILARFTRGFFGGWTFWVEKCVLTFLAEVGGWRVAGKGGSEFPGIPTGTDIPSFPLNLSKSTLPPLYSRLAGGNFMVLDVSLPDSPASLNEPSTTTSNTSLPSNNGTSETPDSVLVRTESYIDFAFGDSRGGFSGCHRFSVLRSASGSRSGSSPRAGVADGNGDTKGGLKGEGEEEIVKVVYASMACNPSEREAKFPSVMGVFHVLYARVLFWDGVREVLRR